MTERYATSQRAAKRLGLYSYYTGRPCPQGHYSERYANSRECMACNRTDYAEKPRRAPITITQKKTLPPLAWAAGWAVKSADPYKGWPPELRERAEREEKASGRPPLYLAVAVAPKGDRYAPAAIHRTPVERSL